LANIRGILGEIMALKKLKTITLPNLNELTGEYWRIYNMESYISSNGQKSTSIGLELWLNAEARLEEEAECITTIKVDAPDLIESRASAYAWMKNNVIIFANAEDV
jgi:hypothetical protein